MARELSSLAALLKNPAVFIGRADPQSFCRMSKTPSSHSIKFALAGLALAASTLSLASCASFSLGPGGTEKGDSLSRFIAQLHGLADSGRWQQVFDAYGDMRENLSLSDRQRLALEYAGILVDQERHGELQLVREHVGLGPLGEEFRVAMLDAALSLEAGEAEVALRFLTLKPAVDASAVDLVRFYTLRGLTGAALNDLALEFDGRAGVVKSLLEGADKELAAVEQEAAAEPVATAEQLAVVADFWQWLRQLRTGDIRAVSRNLRGKHARGWGRLLLRVHDTMLQRQAGDAVLAQWSEEYPEHPAHLIMEEVRDLFCQPLPAPEDRHDPAADR